MLADAGVKDAASLLTLYAPERIIDVCTHAASRRERLTNPAGWINSALRRGWCK
jgi:hypothetical protein